ncbi:hypothetical protein [Paraburkholderia kirstenboschensis]|uniref:hypothetical protein n=1 Tax=Paraburkholderia kirstenboschensis TaxID=1245436 RepID=UPI001FB37D7D|nr:hypothetical protein [Paraburkholderia kirstenboschensis]
MRVYDQNGNVNGSGSPCSIAPVKFLTKDPTTLTTAIGNMQAAGSTMIPTGLLWGWRMLSSDWSSSVSNGNGWVSTDKTLPRPETTQGLQRVAIVLTDGQNDPGSANGIMPAPSFNGLTGVGSSLLKAPTVTRDDGTSLSNGSTTSVTDINAFQLAVCTAMKNDGIIIYAITFGSDASSSVAQTTMRGCASPGNYYHAPTNATLDAIFQQIAATLVCCVSRSDREKRWFVGGQSHLASGSRVERCRFPTALFSSPAPDNAPDRSCFRRIAEEDRQAALSCPETI